jgi:hypothetical protein
MTAACAHFSFHAPMKLHFSIRDLAWLTLVIGMALGWWFDHNRQPYTVETFPDGSAAIIEKATLRRWHKSRDLNFWLEVFRLP